MPLFSFRFSLVFPRVKFPFFLCPLSSSSSAASSSSAFTSTFLQLHLHLVLGRNISISSPVSRFAPPPHPPVHTFVVYLLFVFWEGLWRIKIKVIGPTLVGHVCGGKQGILSIDTYTYTWDGIFVAGFCLVFVSFLFSASSVCFLVSLVFFFPFSACSFCLLFWFFEYSFV
ncbi:hypothetical protein EX30DRAFT_130377 [Ascodesmis nigricans]|uniref:Transmembrane protein n=1 Tax=Ascodesmis nigricans TaxID=341454 RepID=A0A4S2MNN3_9PEZI|nr:hypothetical protein EX30DRAFT_130377 [Ascodesmis nigricans]